MLTGSLNAGLQRRIDSNGTLRRACNDILETTQLRWDSRRVTTGSSFYGNYKFEKRVFVISNNQEFGGSKVKEARKRSLARRKN